MKSGREFLRLFDRFIDRVLCVLGAILFSQGPEFMQQYLQRLGGHLGEARRQLGLFHDTARQSGVTLDQLVQQTAANPDPGIARLGGVMADAVARVDSLQSAHEALAQAALWQRPFVFLRHLDLEIARATCAIYKPAVPTTLEGLVYAVAGMLVFLALYHLVLRRVPGLLGWRQDPAVTTA